MSGSTTGGGIATTTDSCAAIGAAAFRFGVAFFFAGDFFFAAIFLGAVFFAVRFGAAFFFIATFFFAAAFVLRLGALLRPALRFFAFAIILSVEVEYTLADAGGNRSFKRTEQFAQIPETESA